MVLGLTTIGGLAGTSQVKGLMMGGVGLLLGTIGIDPIQGLPRFTFGDINLADGLGFLPVAVGLFGIAELISWYRDRQAPQQPASAPLTD
jgi:putative tricarboxylic transport membrane protein